MRRNAVVSTFVVVTLMLGCLPRVAWPQSASAGAVTFSHDTHGLEKEFEPFVKAYMAGDTPAFDQKFAVFSLPDAEGWFGKYFAKDQVRGLAEDHVAGVAAEQRSLVTLMNLWPKGTHFRVHCGKYRPKSPTKLQPRPDAPTPILEVPLEQLEIKVTADNMGKLGGRSFSFVMNLVDADGAYRYMGKGAYPFWSMPDTGHRAKPGGDR